MGQISTDKTSVIMAGFGGMGVLMAGQILSWGALNKYNHVSWLPSYAVEKRGGLCECTVVFADKEISSPIIDQAGIVIVFAGARFKEFESRVLPGGLMLVESSGLDDAQDRNDYNLYKIPGMETAITMGGVQIANFVFLGAFIGLTDSVGHELIEDELVKKFRGKKEVLELNKKAFRRGIELVVNQKK